MLHTDWRTDTWTDILDGWTRQGVAAVRFETTDLHGIPRLKLVPVGKAREYALDGFPMFGAALALDSASQLVGGTLFEQQGFGNQLLLADPATALVLPWRRDTARVICSPERAGAGRVHPRNLLAVIVEMYGSLGYEPRVAHEFEFYVLATGDRHPLRERGEFLSAFASAEQPFVDDILSLLPACGVDVECAQREYAPGQYEITYSPLPALQSADVGFTFKYAIKEMASARGLIATFMTQPFSDLAASGCHVHVSLADGDGRNAFLSTNDPGELSPIGRSFLAGQLRYGRAMTALMAPTVNCYHRYRMGLMAPRWIRWGGGGPHGRSEGRRSAFSSAAYRAQGPLRRREPIPVGRRSSCCRLAWHRAGAAA